MSIYFDYLDAFENRWAEFEDFLVSPPDKPQPAPEACCRCGGPVEWKPCANDAHSLYLIKWGGFPKPVCSGCEEGLAPEQNAHERTFDAAHQTWCEHRVGHEKR